MFLRHQFPVRGPHGYGEYAARFGGGRGHQGQDIMAACGTPLVAARGGVVKVKQYHSAAGYYIVIDGEQTSVDYAYMHMAEPAIVAKGERVKTGQPIGIVGRTGRASACHLHFEEWSGPGLVQGRLAVRPAARPAGLGQAALIPAGAPRRRPRPGALLLSGRAISEADDAVDVRDGQRAVPDAHAVDVADQVEVAARRRCSAPNMPPSTGGRS